MSRMDPDLALRMVQGLLAGKDDTATIDQKGRIILPKNVREAIGRPFVLMIGKKGCLEATSNANYLSIWSEIERYSPHSDYRREYAVEIMANSFTGVDCEDNGRFVIPAVMREKAKLDLGSNIVIQSAGDVAEIWSAAEFEIYAKDRMGYNRERRQYLTELRQLMINEGATS